MDFVIEEYWDDILKEILENSRRRIIYITGDVDTGKTTFAFYLLSSLTSCFTVGYLDCDPGQSTIGPPCTVSLGVFKKGIKKINMQKPDSVYMKFIGSTSPAGHLLQTVSGIKRLAEKADELKIDKILIDSSGFIKGNVANEFQFQVIDLVRPNYIIEIYNNFSLKPLLRNFKKSSEIIRMKTSDSVVLRNPVKRRQNREQIFKYYFNNIKPHQLNIENYSFHGNINNPYETDLDNILIALCNRNHYVIVLGIIDYIDKNRKTIHFYAPPFSEEKVVSIKFGSIKIDIAGNQLS